MRELPDRYLLEPLELLLCADDSEIPMWVMCVWDDGARQWFAGDREDLARVEASRATGMMVPTVFMRSPTHFFELPPLPARPHSMYN